MALFYECMPKCARKLLDTADIVREAIFASHIWLGFVTLRHFRISRLD